jgi:hypothetical protein
MMHGSPRVINDAGGENVLLARRCWQDYERRWIVA